MNAKDKEKAARILARAEELAQSGRHASWIEIERVLVKEGHAQAARILHSKAKRSWLDALCARSSKTPKT
jgi:uncharacterized protein HemY